MENKSYESITFEVESNLSKPKGLLWRKEIDNILSSIFKRAKGNANKEVYHAYAFIEGNVESLNESMEILNFNFDTDKKTFYNYDKKSLIRGLMEAYGNHYPITITPDMILLLFLQGYTRFMDKNSEKLRNVYVNFKGKKTLIVTRDKMTPETATSEDWQGIIDEFTQKIKEEIGENIISNFRI